MEPILELLKSRYYQIPQILLFNYRNLGLTDSEFIMILYLWNSGNQDYNPKKISNDLGIEMNSVLEIINNLTEKGVLSLNVVKINNVHNEVISMDLLYEKLAFILMKVDKAAPDGNLFDIFEKEIGRGLAPTEYETINGWRDMGYGNELIILALKEAIYNGVTNLRYIDRIIFEWHKKGIKTKEDVEKNRKEFKKNKSNKELFDYDWLNDTKDS